MQVLVTYGGDPIPKSPFTVGVAAPLDLSKIKINGLENSKCLIRSPATSSCDCYYLEFSERLILS